jgi:tetratricopeptide (TPR) repeat protein
MKLILFTIFVIIGNSLFPCINVYRTKLSGEVYYGEPYWYFLGHKSDSLELEEMAQSILEDYQESNSLEDLSDYAATLIYQGKYQKAKFIYLQIERDSANLYTTASNLGTIYELIDKPDSAYYWINKSITINPKSHSGSEWIHLKILDYKTSTNKTEGSILELDFGNELKPKYRYDIQSLENHLNHQLIERLQFITPPNYIMGNLLFDFGNVLAINADLEAAIETYKKAQEFGYNSKLLNDRINFMSKMTKSTENHSEFKEIIKRNKTDIIKIALIGLLSITILIILFVWWRKKSNT